MRAVIALIVVSLSGSTRAADDSAKAMEGQHVVVVPYDASLAPEDQQGSRYYVDYDTFQRLWTRAKDKRAQRAAEAAGEQGVKADQALAQQDFALTSALYRATVEAERVAVEGRLVVVTRGRAWQRVPLVFAGASVSELLIDGQPAAYEGGAILVEKSGRHEIVVHFEVPIAGAAVAGAQNNGKGKSAKGAKDVGNFSGLTRQPAVWQIPSAAASMLAVTMAHPEAVPVINGGLPVVASAESPGLFTVALGQGAEVKLGQRLSTRGRGMTQPNVARIDSHLFVTPALERVEVRYELVFRDQEESNFSIAFDASLTPVSFDIPNLLSWALVDGDDGGLRRLNFELTQPARDSLSVQLVAERLVDDGAERVFPKFAAAALRLEQRQSLLRVDELDVRPQPGASSRQLEFLSEGVSLAGFVPVATFGVAGAPASGEGAGLLYAVAERPGSRTAKADYVYQVGDDKLETVAQFQIRSPESSLSEITVSLPTGSTIQAVRGNRLQEWWRSGDDLFARFSGATPEVTALLVYVSQERDAAAAAQQVALPTMALSGVNELSGAGLVVAHATLDTTLRFAQGREVVREVDALSVATDFEVLPPLERKRGFEFSGTEVSASLALQPVVPRYDITWALLARSFESWVKLSVQVDVAVSRSAIDRLEFSLPADLPEVRVTSPEIREVRSVVVDGRRNYTVVFQRFVTDAVDFIVETEAAHTGEVSIGGLDFSGDGLGREERFVIVENGSSDRLQVDTQQMETTVASALPFEPSALRNPQIFRAREGWSLNLVLEDLKTTAGNDAVVMWSELTTAFLANGEEWLKAVYHLQNRSLQFMPVILPDGAELVSVSVAGESTRADRGTTSDGRETVLVPLIQTKPGQLAYDVELVMRSRAQVHDDGRSVRKFSRKLDDPDVVDIAVQQTLWHLSLPEGFELTDFDGNLEPVSDEELLLEKAEADLAEFEGLNAIGSSDDVGFYSNKVAIDNGGVINSRLETVLLSFGDSAGSSSDGVDKLAQRGQQLRDRLEQQQVILTENRINLPTFAKQKGTASEGVEGEQKGKNSVDWNFNKGELQDRNNDLARAELDQVERLQDQMQINDNIVLGNEFFRNGEAIQADTQSNDKQAAEKADQAFSQVGKLSEGKDGGEVESKLQILAGIQIGHGGYAANADGDEQSGAATQSIDGLISSAQGNVGVNAGGFIDLSSGSVQGGGAMQGQQDQREESQSGWGDYDNGRTNFLQTRSGEMAGKKAQANRQSEPSDPFAAPAAGSMPATAAVEPTQGLKASGRRSVSVDFPAEGRLYHFRKIKDHAELVVTAAEPRDLRQFGWLVLFVLCVGALLAFDAGLRQTRQQG